MVTWAGPGPAGVEQVCACARVCLCVYTHTHPYVQGTPIPHPRYVFKLCWDESEPGCPLPTAVCHWSSLSLAFVICSKKDGASSLWEQCED